MIRHTRSRASCLIILLGAALLLAPPGCQSGRSGPGEPGVTAGHGRVATPSTRMRPPPPPRPLATPTRAVWVARFHYRTPEDVRRIVARCAAEGFNTLLWQVRGDGTVTYPSRIEPWSAQFNHRDPGFDPLALAIEEAHARGLRVEAWFNVLPGWSGSQPPAIAGQLWNARPEWFLTDARGNRQALGDFYVLLNPCLPEVRSHLAALVREIAGNYAIDGIHLDYVRYAWDGQRDARRRFPRDARTLSLYRAETGRTPDADADAGAWDSWRANQLTRAVIEMREALNRARPGATLTAAVRPDAAEARQDHFQNAAAWLRSGLVDAVMPMAYTSRISVFERQVRSYGAVGRGRVIPGIGVYLLQPAALRAQLAHCAQRGGDWAAFSYESLSGERLAEIRAAHGR
ncbi:MAG: family 10 glycosylhydrolase [Phycisphaerales bacterium]|nr:family 10 glycosylhydrolase [Phycisphaerales bacterium]